MKKEIIQADCLEILTTYESNSVDCIVTDPPYSGLNSKSKGTGRFSQSDTHIEFDDMSERAFLLFMKPIFTELYRILKVGGHFYCFTDWKQLRNMADAIELASFKILNIVCWDKGHFGTGAGYRSQAEYILVFSKGLPDSFRLKNVGNVIRESRAKGAEHPHQKPVELIKTLIMNSTDEGDIVLDPFVGSGTTCVAAEETGRNSVGIDLSQEYCEIARRRLDPSHFT